MICENFTVIGTWNSVGVYGNIYVLILFLDDWQCFLNHFLAISWSSLINWRSNSSKKYVTMCLMYKLLVFLSNIHFFFLWVWWFVIRSHFLFSVPYDHGVLLHMQMWKTEWTSTHLWRMKNISSNARRSQVVVSDRGSWHGPWQLSCQLCGYLQALQTSPSVVVAGLVIDYLIISPATQLWD